MPPSNDPPTADDWNSRRDLITRLYRDEDRPLKEIMAMMNGPGFRATPKMFKSRIHKWGLDKKLKEREARAIVHMQARRRGKATRMLLRGKAVDIKTAQSHLKRKGITVEDALKTIDDPLPDLICETPRMSPGPLSPNSQSQKARTDTIESTSSQLQVLIERRRPQHLDSPTLLKTAELLFMDIRECVLSSFETGSWVSNGPDEYCRPKNARVREIGTCEETYTANVLSHQRFNNLRPIETRDTFMKRTWTVEEEQSSMILQYLVQGIALLFMKQSKSIVLELLVQLYDFYTSSGTEKMRTLSVLIRICTRIRILVHNDVALDYLPTALRALIDSHNEVLDQFHLQTIHLAVMLARVMGILYGPTGLTKPLETLHSSLERQQMSASRRSALLLIELENIHIRGGRYGYDEIMFRPA
ncbi:hypothetical protein G7Y79_00038g074270 [Physcia stellaris]|nr:hypothetical protein G7Y79_00038g074270 [Physcia stellaris]